MLGKDFENIGFRAVKCNIMQTLRKRTKKISALNALEGTVLDNAEKINYLSITITNDLKWSTHFSSICAEANRPLGFLRCSLGHAHRTLKGLKRPVRNYCSSVWDPQSIRLQGELEKVQKG